MAYWGLPGINKIMKKLLPLLFVFILTGCPLQPPQTVNTTSIGSDITKGTVYAKQAQKNLSAATQHADPLGQQLITGANQDLDELEDELDLAAVDLGVANKQIEALEKSDQTKTAEIITLNKQFFSPRQRAIFWWIVGLWLGLGVVGVCLTLFLGPIGLMIGTQILHLLPFSNPFNWLSSYITSKKVAAANPL